MDVSNLLAAATVAVVVALPAAAHPGPEPHPTVEELEEVDWRLGERIDELEAQVSEPDQ